MDRRHDGLSIEATISASRIRDTRAVHPAGTVADQLFDFADREDLALDQGFGQPFELVAMSFEQPVSAFVGFAEDPADFLVDKLRGVLGVVARLAHLAAEERVFLGVADEDRPDAVAHSALRDHQPGQPGGPLEVVGDAGREVVEDEALGRPPAQGDGEHGLDVALVVAHAVFRRAGTASRPGHGRGG